MIHCWVSLSKKCICRFNDFHGTQTLHNSKICQCLLFHESDKQNFSCTQLYKSIPSVKEAIAIVILWLHSTLVVSQAKLRPTKPARMGSTSHWSHELNLCRLQVLIMHGPYLVTSTTVHSLYRLWVACLVFHAWSQVAMCALTWVIFALCFFHADNGLSGKMLTLCEIFKCSHLKLRFFWLQASKHTRAHVQCGLAIVGLAQAHPNQQ